MGFDSAESAFALLGELESGVDGLIKGEYWKVGAEQLLRLGQEMETLAHKIAAARIHLVHELDQQGVAAQRSSSSLAVLLRQMLLISPADAASRVRAAKATQPQDLPSGGETPASLPLWAAAVDAGAVGSEHTRIAVATLRRIHDRLTPEQHEPAEAFLVEQATHTDPEQFRTIARHLETVVDPDGKEPVDAAGKQEFSIGCRNPGTGLTSIHGFLDDLSIATLRAAINPLAAPKPEIDGVKDIRPAALRRAHALVEALGFTLHHGNLPTSGGERPHITVTLDWDAIQQQVRSAALDNGQPLSAGDARRLLCDAKILPAVLRGNSEVLDVGRAMRTAPAGIRTAITLRDRGCIWPGCDRPPNWCESHHVKWWAKHLGDTSYHNMVLLCRYHHNEIHKTDWEIAFARDGIPELIPPKWLDAAQRPRRNTLHQLELRT